jgi:hypothetical protein
MIVHLFRLVRERRGHGGSDRSGMRGYRRTVDVRGAVDQFRHLRQEDPL